MSGNWDWSSEDNAMLTVVPRVMAIAVYTNPRDEIVIRQEGMHLDNEDQVIVIPKDRVSDLIAALQSEVSAE